MSQSKFKGSIWKRDFLGGSACKKSLFLHTCAQTKSCRPDETKKYTHISPRENAERSQMSDFQPWGRSLSVLL